MEITTILAILTSSVLAAETSKSYSINREFEDVVFDRENAIVNEGLISEYRSYINDTLERFDVGTGYVERKDSAYRFIAQ